MTEERITPEEFARLISLPESDPDRRRVAGTPAFEALRAMHADFERPAETKIPPEDARRAREELTGRLRAARAAGEPRAAAERAPHGIHGAGPIERLVTWLRTPAGRAGLVFAVLVIVAGLGWWGRSRESAALFRGESSDGAFVPVAAAPKNGEVAIQWGAVSGADAYRVVFLAPDLTERAHVDVGATTGTRLRAGALPPGLATGSRVPVEVVALRGGRVIATSSTREIQLP